MVFILIYNIIILIHRNQTLVNGKRIAADSFKEREHISDLSTKITI